MLPASNILAFWKNVTRPHIKNRFGVRSVNIYCVKGVIFEDTLKENHAASILL